MPHGINSGQNRRPLGEKIGDRVSIRQRGETWYANWQENGRQQRESLKTANVKEARTRARRIEREIEERAAGLTKPIEPTSIEAAIDAYDEYLVSEARRPKTLAKYRLVFRHVKDLARARHVETIDGLDIVFSDAYRAKRRREGAAENTRYNESTILLQLVRFAVSRRLVAADPIPRGSLRLSKPKFKPSLVGRTSRQSRSLRRHGNPSRPRSQSSSTRGCELVNSLT